MLAFCMGNGQCQYGVPLAESARAATRSPIGTRSRCAAAAADRAAYLACDPIMETRRSRQRSLACSECPICMGEHPGRPVARPINCDHLFHLECLLQWAMIENSCPVCRRSFNYIVGPRIPVAVVDAVQPDTDEF